MRGLKYGIFCVFLGIVGYLFFLQQESWLVITFPFWSRSTQKVCLMPQANYKTVMLYGWVNHALKKESTEIMYTQDKAQTLKLLLNSWLIFLEDEQVTEKQTQVMSVALVATGAEALISLNQYPFEGAWSTHQKLMWVESMLKTIRENSIDVTAIRLLVHHQPLQDDHLDFDISWPVGGFLS